MKYLLSAYDMPGTILRVRGIAVNKANKSLCCYEGDTEEERETDNKQTSKFCTYYQILVSAVEKYQADNEDGKTE